MVPDDDHRHMQRALELAQRGEGRVEPNPMVGCVLVRQGVVVGEGWHQRFGGPHAEAEALSAAGDAARGATAYVTLEPCCHHGKTPPCADALLAAGVQRVVVATSDPHPLVSGQGLARLAEAGGVVDVGLLAPEAERLVAPFDKLMTRGRPWVIAKWAMSCDGKLATRAGESRWISGEESRAVVHALRGRVDAVVAGHGTVEADDPLLTARPPGPRTPTRIVLDSLAQLAAESQLVRMLDEAPVFVAAGPDAPPDRCERLRSLGVEVWQATATDFCARWTQLLEMLGQRQMTNVLVEGGAQTLGSLLDAREIDEVHVFVAPRLFGGAAAPSPVAGSGFAAVSESLTLEPCVVQRCGDDAYLSGRVRR
ncbi:MAG TPA: bifunctional diaminohydroxyphosphoribosylaminopyrimidine deaminase/5-amino-6-(5-phosphoribosylamino)uracil reductase RibD [Lacipirellulaceae bacterium]|nr:bifunctional diaminohydroxyphosphoribosylaminopyrimidine deaminase/5-amino-6-(5-phosphoribosylamino)uracil reductase RibD [Lacipirellulaceae bacterium]